VSLMTWRHAGEKTQMTPTSDKETGTIQPAKELKPDRRARGPIGALANWADFVKISHTIFAMPFALASMAVASRETYGWPGWRLFLLIALAMFLARTCAMAFNRIMDRKFDAKNPRTANRHLPSGKISLVSAWTLWAVSAVGFVAVSAAINFVCLVLSPVALFVVCFYSLTKRFTDFTHVYLGIALGLAPIGAWIAVTGGLNLFSSSQNGLVPILMAAAVVFWLIGFDIVYSTQDYEFDRRAGLRSLVVRWGTKLALKRAFQAHMVMVLLLFAMGIIAGFRYAYFPCILLIAILLSFEHVLARRRTEKAIQIAFFRLNAVVSVVFLVATLVEIWFPKPW